MQVVFHNVMVTQRGYQNGEALILQFEDPVAPGGEGDDQGSKKKGKAKVVLFQESDVPTALPFWGKVVEEKVANFLPHSTTIAVPITHTSAAGDVNTFNLYLDGKSYMDIELSTCCFAWFVPTPKEPPVASTRGKAKATTKAEPAKKKAKVFDDKTQRQLEITTHHVEYETVGITLFGDDFEIGRPMTCPFSEGGGGEWGGG